ncbi:methyltransferase domain-containing protein [Candidatus Leptofilum sp.]|uniref:methyltransferase domain-containing protein n=1 Tax=Candidatus Leptofilum sp. TaxID=3241576 RepID=UPI003B58DA56
MAHLGKPDQSIHFVCPVCRGELTLRSENSLDCVADGLTFTCEAGIWRFLPPERVAALAQFRQEYETVRQREGRGSDDPAFYRKLPFVNEAGWAFRARSFETLIAQVIRPFTHHQQNRPLHILDLGAGNGWLSNRLAAEGHELTAVDLGINMRDGLGAKAHYQTKFTAVQAEFDHLPLDDAQVDLVIFNAAFHYSVNYEQTLQEATRVLRPEGWVVVMDTAVYQQQSSGQQMVAEREAAFTQKYGFASNALPSENFLTPARLDAIANNLQLHWRQIETVSAWRRWVRQLKVRLRQQREPAQFPLILFSRPAAESEEAASQSFGHIGRNSLWLWLARVGQQGIGLLFLALVARQLGDVGLGQLSWVTAVLYIGNVFSTFGLDTVLLRQIGATRRTDTAPLANVLALELLFAAIFYLGLWLLPFSGQTAATVAGLRLYGWVLLPLAWLTVSNAALRAYEQMGWLAVLTLGTALFQLGGTAVLFAFGVGFAGLIGWLVVVQIVSAGGSWWSCRRILPNFGINWQLLRLAEMRKLAKVGVWLALLMVTAVLFQRIGILILGWQGTMAQTGQMAVSLRLVEAARLLPAAVMGAVFPVLARQQAPMAGWVHWGLLGYGLLAAILLTVLARPLIFLLFGDTYETAVPPLQLLAWGLLPFALSQPLALEMIVAGAEKRVLAGTFFTLVGTAVIGTAAFQWQGLNGLSVGLVAGEWLLVIALWILH